MTSRQSDGNQLRVHFRSAVTYARDGYEQQLIDYVVPPRCVPPEYQVGIVSIRTRFCKNSKHEGWYK